jgi:ABC-type glycerol-3-phosphate transport system substrate-binding protein
MAKNLKTALGGAVDMTVVDKRRGNNFAAAVLSANYTDETALNNALGVAGYSDANINLMTVNDKIYAVRLANDAAGI